MKSCGFWIDWTILTIKLQLAIVYIYAGAAKLNPDWLFNAMPLKIWLPANAHLPLIGSTITGLGMGVLGAWYAMLADVVVRSILITARFWQGGWKRIPV